METIENVNAVKVRTESENAARTIVQVETLSLEEILAEIQAEGDEDGLATAAARRCARRC